MSRYSKQDRGDRFRNPRGVLAYERYETVHFSSMNECIDYYGIPSTSALERLIRNGSVWHDGYTTFDWALDSPNRTPIPMGKKRQ